MQLAATFEVPLGWERFEWEGTLGGVRHRAATEEFHPNVLVTLDKWPGAVTASQAIEILRQQLTAAGAEVVSDTTVEGEHPTVEVAVRQQDESGTTMHVRYRLQLLAAGEDTLVLTAVATCMLNQLEAVNSDVATILESVELTTSATRDA